MNENKINDLILAILSIDRETFIKFKYVEDIGMYLNLKLGKVASTEQTRFVLQELVRLFETESENLKLNKSKSIFANISRILKYKKGHEYEEISFRVNIIKVLLNKNFF